MDILKKFTSRKFIMALVGVLTGVALILAGEMVEGVSTVITSVLGYLISEGVIDAMAAGQVAHNVSQKLDGEMQKNGEVMGA